MAVFSNLLNFVFTLIIIFSVARLSPMWYENESLRAHLSSMSHMRERFNYNRSPFQKGSVNGNSNTNNNVKAPADSHAQEFFAKAHDFRCPQDRVIGKSEIQRHDTADDLWIVIDGNVLDMSNFVSRHPGGLTLLEGAGGDDMATVFAKLHHPSTVELFQNFCIGRTSREQHE